MKLHISVVTILLCLMITISQAHDTISVEYNVYTKNDCFYAVYSDGNLYRFDVDDENSNQIKRVKILEDVTDVSRNFALKEDGTVWTWENDALQPVFITDSAVAITSGATSSGEISEVKTLLILKDNGELWGYGNNGFGQLAQEVRDNDESRSNYISEPTKITEDVIAMGEGTGHTIVLKSDGTVWTVGSNWYGQLGTGVDVKTVEMSNDLYKVMDNAISVFASGGACFAVGDDNIMYRWGTNYAGYLGNLDKYVFTKPVQYVKDAKYAENFSGHNLIIKNDNSLWVYGESDEPESFMIGDRKYIQIPIKLCENINSIASADGDEYCRTILTIDTNRRLSILKFNENYKKEDDPIYNLYPISNNVRLSTDEPIKVNFSDIDAISDTEKNAVNKLAKAGIINGITETEFMPDKEITRAETAALLLRMTGKGDETGEASFSDVSANDWYYGTAGASQKYGIINGYEDNTFRGNETVSELQLVSLAARTLRNEGTAVEPEETKTLGAGIVPDWAYEDIEYALNHEIITEAEASNISDKPVTRGEAAVILYRLYNVV